MSSDKEGSERHISLTEVIEKFAEFIVPTLQSLGLMLFVFSKCYLFYFLSFQTCHHTLFTISSNGWVWCALIRLFKSFPCIWRGQPFVDGKSLCSFLSDYPVVSFFAPSWFAMMNVPIVLIFFSAGGCILKHSLRVRLQQKRNLQHCPWQGVQYPRLLQWTKRTKYCVGTGWKGFSNTTNDIRQALQSGTFSMLDVPLA